MAKRKEEKSAVDTNHYFFRVYDVTRLIPVGRVTTFGAIADFLGLGSARMVGWALNQCHNYDMKIPAHRVVNRKGELSGRLQFATPTLMEELLIAEGVVIKDDKVVNFEQKFWHPRELEQY
ncbi:MAG: MGMT family protein [Saprospiraceae bacterium]|nr:MAG: methylated-DNA-(protein)-cysteine S-methyltransferase DNA binding protein [Bacteroidetes bacterium OLB9]MCO6463577.1 MGMT family protein [Saprospiraceae bacterium]MCZ2339618.1 MGMT family protein [Chitinophagales bacterium]